jgi:hypothetical protein
MTPDAIVVGLMLLTMWLTLASSWRLRNWRAAGIVLAASVLILLRGPFPSLVTPFVQGGAWGAAMLLLLSRTDLVSVPSPEEVRFVEEYVRIMKSLSRLKEPPVETASATQVELFLESAVMLIESAVKALRNLRGSGEWARLQADTVRELERGLEWMKPRAWPSAEALREAEARQLELQQRFRQLVKAKAGFWAGWPPFSRRPSG